MKQTTSHSQNVYFISSHMTSTGIFFEIVKLQGFFFHITILIKTTKRRYLI